MVIITQLQSIQHMKANSPDRKAMHAQALKMAKKVEEEQPKDLCPLTWVGYLVMDDLYLTLNPQEQQAKNQGCTVTTVLKTGGVYGYQIHYGGEMVMMSIKGQWSAILTEAAQKGSE